MEIALVSCLKYDPLQPLKNFLSITCKEDRLASLKVDRAQSMNGQKMILRLPLMMTKIEKKIEELKINNLVPRAF